MISNNAFFTQIPENLAAILLELRRLEPIFHNANFGTTTEDYERTLAPGFWEVGASGRRYSREFILKTYFKDFQPITEQTKRWTTTEFGIRQLAPDLYLLTYTLDQSGRQSRRATIWKNTVDGWRIVYHQGTILVSKQDDTLSA